MVVHAETLVLRCRAALTEQAPERVVAAVLRDVVAADPAAVRDALLGDDAAVRSGAPLGMRVLCDSADLTIFHASLPPRFVNAPHDHRTWAVVAVYAGEERNVYYERRGATIVPVRERCATAPDVVVMGADAIHAIENRLPEPSYAIHVYGNAHLNVARSMWHPETLVEEPRDEKVFHGWCRDMIARGVRLPVVEG